jgi:hypothetical protein
MGKYTINGYVPNPILYNLPELVILIFFGVLPLFFKIADNRKTLEVVKRMKDGYVIGCLVPLITSSINCIVLEIYRFVDPCQSHSYYFNEEEAYLTFDCHPNSIPGGKIALIEYLPTLIYLILPSLVYVLSNTGIATTIVFLCIQVILFLAHFKNMSQNLWRDDYGLFGLLSMSSTFFRILYGILMVLFWSLPTRLNLTGIQVMTRFFAAFYILDLVLIVV